MIRGHDADVSPYMALGYKVSRCPLLISSSIDKFYIHFYNDYQRGLLPNAGGTLDQPMKFYSLMAIIQGAMAKIDKEEEDVRPKS